MHPTLQREPRVEADPSATFDRQPHRPRVVVALRASRPAAAAVAVGLAETSRRGADLVVAVVGDDRDAAAADTAAHVTSLIAASRRGLGAGHMTAAVRTGLSADAVIQLSRSSDLLILGWGKGEPGRDRNDALLAAQARCPVIVVHERSR